LLQPLCFPNKKAPIPKEKKAFCGVPGVPIQSNYKARSTEVEGAFEFGFMVKVALFFYEFFL
jgi:hypothetical protein